MDKIRTGVIGVGMMGQRHCRVYSTLRNVEFVAVSDANEAAGTNIAQQYGATYYPTVEEMLDHVDAVSLVTPTPYHFDLAKMCLERGIHLLIEKPITETVEQAEIICQLAEASGLVVQVGHIERFNSTFIELKNVLKEMTLLAVNLRRLSAFENSNMDVNVVLDLMIHDSDLALNLMGSVPRNVNAQGLKVMSNVVDHATAFMSFDTGALLTMTASRVTEQKIRMIEVTATEGYVECDLLDKKILVHRRTSGRYLPHSGKYRHESIVERIHVPVVEPLYLELQHFANCVITGEEPQVSARDGLEALKLVDQILMKIHADIQQIEVPQAV